MDTFHPLEGEENTKAQKECGVRGDVEKSFIAHGTDANIEDFPWSLALFESVKDESGSFLLAKCGATLISSRHAISAAHCFFNLSILNGKFKYRNNIFN